MTDRIVSVGDDFALAPGTKVLDTHLPTRLGTTALNATYVTFVDSVTGLPLVDKHVTIKVDQSGPVAEIADIVVEDI
jgi:hypothetical protein